MVYSKQTWADNDPTRPLSAARMNKLETQAEEVTSDLANRALGTGNSFVMSDSAGALPNVILNNLDGRFSKNTPTLFSLPPSPASGLSVVQNSLPRAIEYFSNRTWGNTGGVISFSENYGSTWTAYCPTPDGDSVRRLIPTNDSEVICATGNGLYKSLNWSSGSPTWSKKITTNATAQFFPFNVAGNGQKFIASQYSANTRPDSRYAHISVDNGTTWTQVWDSVALFGATAANASHVHGCEYDDRSGRFYISEGHGSIAGIYYSSDNGATWSRPAGLVQDPSPTVMVATDDGLVCGSDHAQAGVYGVVRQGDPNLETIKRTFAWRSGRSGVVGFGVRGYRDPSTGTVYIGFRSEFADVAPIIAGGSATAAGLVYEWPTLPVTISDSFGAVIVESKNLMSSATVNGLNYTVRGRIGGPSVKTDDTGGIFNGTALDGRSVSAGAGSTTGSSASSVAVGVSASVTATQQGTAIGAGSSVTGSSGVAVGDNSLSGGTGVAVGSGSSTGGFGGVVAIGSGTVATGGGQSTIVGSTASSALTSTAVGYAAKANGSNSAAVGKDATTSNDGVAFGVGANAGGSQTALGRNAIAAHAGSTALGKDTATTGVNQTAFGPRSHNLQNLSAAPATISNSGSFYVMDGALYFKGSSGTVTMIAPA